MANEIELSYSCDLGVQNISIGSAAYNKVANLVLDPNDEIADRLGLLPTSDSVAEVGGLLVRTLLYEVLPSASAQFPSDALLKAATRELFTAQLAANVPCKVTAAEPVVS